jgi:linoleoyl-CoA desaturase
MQLLLMERTKLLSYRLFHGKNEYLAANTINIIHQLNTEQKRSVKFTDQTQSTFYSTLKHRIDQYFNSQNISRHANKTMVIKSVTLLSIYIVPFVTILVMQPPFWVMNILWILMGFGLAGIGMSIMHDANHGAYSSNPRVNYIMGHSLNLVGGSVSNWKLQHNILHHTYTNIAKVDDDIDDKLVMRFNPHTGVKSHHRFQFIYAFFFYGILTLYWALLKDFIQFVKYNRNGVNPASGKENRVLLLRMVIDKMLYFFLTLGLPILVGIPVGYVITGFLLMHFVAGIVLTVVFQLAHTVEGTSHPLPDDQGNIDNAWAIHQMHTTVNFSSGNPFLTWYLGGLNYQIEHHLFPRICHVHYPALSPIVKATALEYGIPYMENKTFMSALRSHINLLKRFGKLPSMNEAIG